MFSEREVEKAGSGDLSLNQRIGRHLKSERCRLNLKHEQVAAAAGIHKSSLYNYEAGSRCPDLKVVIRLAALGFRFGELLGEIPNPASTDRELLSLVGQLLLKAGAK